MWSPGWCRCGAVFGRMSGARIVPVGWLRARSTELSTASPLPLPCPLHAALPSMCPFVAPLCCLPVRLGAIRMKNGLSVRLPFRGRRRTLRRPACSTEPSSVPWSTRTRHALGPSACRGGGATPLHVPDKDATTSRTTAVRPPRRRPGAPRAVPDVPEDRYLVDPASSHMLVSKIKPCMCKYELIQTVKLRMAH